MCLENITSDNFRMTLADRKLYMPIKVCSISVINMLNTNYVSKVVGLVYVSLVTVNRSQVRLKQRLYFDELMY